jgi:hypothetical protein
MKKLLSTRVLHPQKNRAECMLFSAVLASFMLILGVGVLSAAPSDEVGSYDYSAQSLRTSLWLDKADDEVYQKGDFQTVGFQTNEDAYAVIYRVDTEGLVSILWPRSRYDDGFVFSGHEYLLPVSGTQRLQVSGQEGEGFVEAIVSRYAFDLRDLAIDFHHEQGAEIRDFFVAGDPFLAMNEVNFAITGLEDAADYVITNYRSYYVHQKVEHPRYLCVQCHDENEVVYEPYHDTCTLEISYDYGWYNSWYGRYGYYPIYSQPVYVYVDPWGYNPWVNFWYTPYYTCAPTPYYSWSYSTYCWNDSPYYYGNSNVRYKNGNGRYRPLGKNNALAGRDARSYEDVTRMVRGKPSGDVRTAMREKTPVVGTRGGAVRADVVRGNDTRVSDTRFRGEAPVKRPRSQYEKPANRTGQSGLRIRTPDSKGGSRPAAGGSRHVASDSDGERRAPTSSGVNRTHINRGSSTSVHNPVSGGRATPNREGSRATSTIRTVEPRQKGTRVWNNSSRNEESGSANKPAQVRPSNRENDGSRTGKQPERIKPRSSSSGTSRSTVKKQPKKTTGSSSRSSGSSSGSSSRSSTVKKSSSKSSGSSAKKSGGGTSRSSSSKSSSSRSSGGRSSQRR